MNPGPTIKIVGRRKNLPTTPEESLKRAQVLQEQLDKLNPYPRPRGFVFKAKSYEEYEQWRKNQTNPRLW